jgi:hypothetical protein
MAKKAATKKKAAPQESAPAEKVSNSQAVRDYLQANPKALPKQTVEALAEQGIEVSRTLVSQIKFKMKPKKRRGRKKAARGAKPGGDKIALSSLITAKKMAEQLGGLEKAKAALAALAKLQ